MNCRSSVLHFGRASSENEKKQARYNETANIDVACV